MDGSHLRGQPGGRCGWPLRRACGAGVQGRRRCIRFPAVARAPINPWPRPRPVRCSSPSTIGSCRSATVRSTRLRFLRWGDRFALFHRLFRDRDGAIWIGTKDGGLLHLHESRLDGFTRSDGLSGDHAENLFQDREGNVWFSTTDGVDRFGALAATTYSSTQGVSGIVFSVLADPDGSIWLGTTMGLHRWHDARMSVYRPRFHHEPLARSSTPTAFGTVETVEVFGLPEPAATSLFRDQRGRLWLGSRTDLGYLDHDHFVSVGEPGGYVDSIVQDSDGNLWIARRDAGTQKVSGDRVAQQVRWADISRHTRLPRTSACPRCAGSTRAAPSSIAPVGAPAPSACRHPSPARCCLGRTRRSTPSRSARRDRSRRSPRECRRRRPPGCVPRGRRPATPPAPRAPCRRWRPTRRGCRRREL